jgi:hypothetical protein
MQTLFTLSSQGSVQVRDHTLPDAASLFTLEPAVFITQGVLNSRFPALNALQQYGVTCPH